jgi:hypothetical protein
MALCCSISLDHDLGDDSNGTGYNVACYIEEAACTGQLQPLEIYIHLADPVGRMNMEAAIARAKVHWNRNQAERT